MKCQTQIACRSRSDDFAFGEFGLQGFDPWFGAAGAGEVESAEGLLVGEKLQVTVDGVGLRQVEDFA